MPQRGYTGFTYGPEGAAVRHEPADISPERLWREYIAPRRPVIIDGLPPEEGFKAARWTHLPYLAALAGDVPVRVEPRHPSGQFGTAIPRRTMRFGDFVESLGPDAHPAQRGTVYLTTQYDAPSDEESEAEGEEPARLGKRRRSFSSERSSPAPSTVSLTPSKSEMDPLLPAPCHALVSDFPPQPKLMGNLLLQQVNLWLGSSPEEATENSVLTGGKIGQTSGLHHDFHDNLYVLLRGEKRFLLFPPDAHPYLHLRGDVARVHHNGLIVYEQEDEESDDESEFYGLVRGPPPSAGELIRADGLPESQAEKWRVRARTRKVQEMEDALALSHGGAEAQRARHKRKGKARMSAQLAEALEQVAAAQRGYELAKLFELGVRPAEDSDLGSDSDSGSSEFDSSSDDDESEEEEEPVQRKKSRFSSAPRQGTESDSSVDEDELAMLLDDATTPLSPHLVEYLKQQQANGHGSEEDQDDSKDQDDSDNQDEDDENDDEDDEDDEDDDSGVEEDELAALLAEASEPMNLPPADAESAPSESEGSNGRLTRAQLEQLKARYGAAGSTGDSEELPAEPDAELQLTTPMLREAVALANPDGPLVDVEEDDLRSLVYEIPRAWAAAGAPILDPALAAHLRDVWELLDQAGDSEEESDSEDDDEGLPFFDDVGSMASFDPRNAEDGEAYLAGLGNEAAPPEPPSFSRIKPQDLWAHFGLAAQGKKNKKSKMGKFDPQLQVPLPGCPPPLVAQLKPGQMLFLPASWFHEVTSFASAPGDVHMALNYWFHPPTNTVGAPAYRKKKRSAAGSAQAAEEGAGLPPPLAFEAPYLDTEVADEVRAGIQAKLAQAKEEGEQYAAALAGTALVRQADEAAQELAARSCAGAQEASEDQEGESVEIDLSQLPPEKVAALMSVFGAESSEEDEPKKPRRDKGRKKGKHLPFAPSPDPEDTAGKKHKNKKKVKKARHDKPDKLDERPSKRRRT